MRRIHLKNLDGQEENTLPRDRWGGSETAHSDESAPAPVMKIEKLKRLRWGSYLTNAENFGITSSLTKSCMSFVIPISKTP